VYKSFEQFIVECKRVIEFNKCYRSPSFLSFALRKGDLHKSYKMVLGLVVILLGGVKGVARLKNDSCNLD